MLGIPDDKFLGIIDRIYFFAVITAAVATAISIIASIFQYQLNQRISNAKDETFRLYQQKTTSEVTDANKAADIARNDAAQANLAAKNAEVKTAQLDKEAAEARLETMRIRQQLAWRSLSSQQKDALSAYCKVNLVNVEIKLSYQSDPETVFFITQIFNVMLGAGTRVIVHNEYMDQPFIGSKIRGPSASERAKLEHALQIIGLQPSIEDGGSLEIIIGLKKPPQL